MTGENHLTLIGWREWLALPELGIPAIKAKVDTGARTSCLHTFKQEEFTQGGAPWVRFWLHPMRNHSYEICCEAPIIDRRYVSDSGGHKEFRVVIETEMGLGIGHWGLGNNKANGNLTEQGEARSVGFGAVAPFNKELTEQGEARSVGFGAVAPFNKELTEQGEARSVGFGEDSPIKHKIEITLSNRESMLFRMLLGRTSMLERLAVNPALSYTLGRPDTTTLRQLYPEG